MTRGYTIPLGTKLAYCPDNYDLGKEMDQTFHIDFLKTDPEGQKVALRSAIASKFGDTVADEVYAHTLPKKQEFDSLPEKIIFVKAQKQYIYIVASGGGLIEIYIYNPGYSPLKSGYDPSMI